MNITKRTEVIGTIDDLAILNEEAYNFNAKNRDNETVTLNDYKGKKVLISVFPDINTSVCDTQTRHFFSEASKLEGVVTLNISNNTVEELNDWCATSGLDVLMLSDDTLDFAKAYGVYMSDANLLARSIFLVDESGTLIYKEVIQEITQEPNYAKVFEKIKEN